MDVTIVGSREARARWRDLLDAARSGTADIVIERGGHPVAALIPYADYQALADELEDLRAAHRAQKIYEEWKRDPSSATPWEQVKAELAAGGRSDD